MEEKVEMSFEESVAFFEDESKRLYDEWMESRAKSEELYKKYNAAIGSLSFARWCIQLKKEQKGQ